MSEEDPWLRKLFRRVLREGVRITSYATAGSWRVAELELPVKELLWEREVSRGWGVRRSWRLYKARLGGATVYVAERRIFAPVWGEMEETLCLAATTPLRVRVKWRVCYGGCEEFTSEREVRVPVLSEGL